MASTTVLQKDPPLAGVATTSSTEDVWPHLPEVVYPSNVARTFGKVLGEASPPDAVSTPPLTSKWEDA
eukprot:9610929-Prorocentrum_lima.AAC.1